MGSNYSLCQFTIFSSLSPSDLPDAMFLTETGKKRSTQVLRPKLEAIFDILVEPNPVCGLVSFL